MYTKKLDNSGNMSDMGSKCCNLAILTELGFKVPKAFGVTFTAFVQFINPLIPEIKTIINENEYKAASAQIRELIINAKVPNDVEREIENAVMDFLPEIKFAVRSSGVVMKDGEAIIEDSAKKSLAGQYESFLNVSQGEILNAVKLCWASLFNERSLHLFEAKKNHTFLESKMSVVIQHMIVADVSAVMMTQDPLEKKALLAMETTYGPCEAIVSGKVTGDLITVDRNKMVVYKKEVGSKRNKVVYDLFNDTNRGNYSLQPTTNEMQKSFSVDNRTALRIACVGLDIEKKMGCPQDVELVISGQEIFIVQTRTITTIIK
jgi:phosphoenolpyruvate synthase/pyruvate phosphate dikinase